MQSEGSPPKADAQKISCSTFQKQEIATKNLTDKINKTVDIKGKIQYAEELVKEADVLLNCPEYKQQDFDCRNCRTIADLRKETAELIIRARKLV